MYRLPLSQHLLYHNHQETARINSGKQTTDLSNDGLQTLNAVGPDDKPQFQGPEPAAERDAPVLPTVALSMSS